ncbi:MAG: TetR/AcrR family transcriptional regulator [Solobacterium sp.]|nr:TetR/AcrR family transcriptional regulator [Solobacterium sp.]
MPKIIEDAHALIFETARRALKEEGKIISLRGIAKQCGISPGTVYNYYRDKSSLIEDVMADDWNRCLEDMSGICRNAGSFPEAAAAVFVRIRDITNLYRQLITAEDMTETWFNVFSKRHYLLIGSIAHLLAETGERLGLPVTQKDAEIVSEMVVCCAQQPAYSEQDITDFAMKMNF